MNHFARSSPGWKSRTFLYPLSGSPWRNLPVSLSISLACEFRLLTARPGEACRQIRDALYRLGGHSPQDIIGYVVRETAGLATETSMTDSGQVYRVLDPACGAGLFLLAAYRFLVRTRPGAPVVQNRRMTLHAIFFPGRFLAPTLIRNPSLLHALSCCLRSSKRAGQVWELHCPVRYAGSV